MPKNPKIALIHDELIRRGGAEIVFEELIRIFPSADVFALYAGNNPQVTIDGVTHPIHTSFLQRFPAWFRRHPGRILPLLPQAAEQFNFSQYDLIISSSSGFAKGIITRSTIPHICYCHTPTRYLWDTSQEAASRAGRGKRSILKVLQHYLRMVDFAAAQRPDVLIANSRYTQERIKTYYRRNSTVVYPPINTAFFTPKPSEKLNISQAPFLLVGRLTPSKYFEQAISVCEKLQLPLVVVGTGCEMNRLRKHAGHFTRFVGKASSDELRTYYRQARALLQPGIEDFGMVSAEALACGTPVIAFGQGGVREIIEHGKHGILYNDQLPESLAEAIRQFFTREHTFTIEQLQQRALTFSQNRFRQSIQSTVEETVKKRDNKDSRQHMPLQSLPITTLFS